MEEIFKNYPLLKNQNVPRETFIGFPFSSNLNLTSVDEKFVALESFIKVILFFTFSTFFC
mgnify:CR=1 FL=1